MAAPRLHLVLIHFVVCFVFIINSEIVVVVPENAENVYLYTESFQVRSNSCAVLGVQQEEGSVQQGPHADVNWTSPTSEDGRQYSFNVTLVGALDREEARQAYIKLYVINNCGSGTEQLDLPRRTIFVSDVKDSPPRFQQDRYTTIVSENLAVDSTVLCNITAVDEDTNDPLSYYLQISGADSQFFQGVSQLKLIDGNNQMAFDIVLAKALDYEAATRYSFIIIAKDSMNLTGSCEVVVEVKDIQDTPPAFTLPMYSSRVDEMVAVGTSVASVSATDRDGAPIRNQIAYSLDDGPSDWFTVDNMTGVISTLRALDIDGEQSVGMNGLVILTVLAKELNTSGQVQYGVSTARTTVQIQIDDANDHPPQFSAATYSGSIRGGAVAGEIVAIDGGGYISVTDRDMAPTNNHFSLHIEKEGAPWSVFEPNVKSQYVQASVLVVLMQPQFLDGLHNTHIRFQLVATDLASGNSSNGRNTTSSTADIIVFVLPKVTEPPPPEPVIDLPITTSDVIVFIMGAFLLLNIILTIIICCLLRRNASNTQFGIFRRNSKYYVSEREEKKEGNAIQRISRQIDEPTVVNEVQNPAFTSIPAVVKPDDVTLLPGTPGINRNPNVRNSVLSAVDRNRCDVTLLKEVNTADAETTTPEINDVIVSNELSLSNKNQTTTTSQSHRCDVTPLTTNGITGKSNDPKATNTNGVISKEITTLVPATNLNLKPRDDDACHVAPLERSMSQKSKSLTQLLGKVHQKLASGSRTTGSDTCDLRPLQEDTPSPDSSFTSITNSNNSSFSEKNKRDVTPLITAPPPPPRPKPTRQTPAKDVCQVNEAFHLEETVPKRIVSGNPSTASLGQDKDQMPNEWKEPPSSSNNMTGLSAQKDRPAPPPTPQPVLAVQPGHGQITQTGVPPVALALPFGTTVFPKDENNAQAGTVKNPVYQDETSMAIQTRTAGNGNNTVRFSNADTNNLSNGNRKLASQNGSDGAEVRMGSPSPTASRSEFKDYMKAAKSLLHSASTHKQ